MTVETIEMLCGYGMVLFVAVYLILTLAFGIPYMIGIAKFKLSCMTNKKEPNHGQEEEGK
jgi:hypothetical protein